MYDTLLVNSSLVSLIYNLYSIDIDCGCGINNVVLAYIKYYYLVERLMN